MIVWMRGSARVPTVRFAAIAGSALVAAKICTRGRRSIGSLRRLPAARPPGGPPWQFLAGRLRPCSQACCSD